MLCAEKLYNLSGKQPHPQSETLRIAMYLLLSTLFICKCTDKRTLPQTMVKYQYRVCICCDSLAYRDDHSAMVNLLHKQVQSTLANNAVEMHVHVTLMRILTRKIIKDNIRRFLT